MGCRTEPEPRPRTVLPSALSQTRAKLRSFPKAHVQYIRFTIGNVRTRDETSAHQSLGQEIVKRDFTPIELVIQWIHTHATGRTLRGYPSIRPTLWERIQGWAQLDNRASHLFVCGTPSDRHGFDYIVLDGHHLPSSLSLARCIDSLPKEKFPRTEWKRTPFIESKPTDSGPQFTPSIAGFIRTTPNTTVAPILP